MKQMRMCKIKKRCYGQEYFAESCFKVAFCIPFQLSISDFIAHNYSAYTTI